MTFFVVFYSGHVFSRYNDLYNLTKEMLEYCVQTAMLLRVNIADERVRWKVMKLVLASVFMFLFERTSIKDDYTVDNEEDSMSRPEWEQLMQLGFITPKECAKLESHCKALKDDAIPSFVVLQWCIELLRHTTHDPNNRFDMLDAFDSCFYSCWQAQVSVVNVLELPMPFQYFHIMNLMLMINLVLWAYSLALQESLFAPFIFMFVQMMFQGIRELATSLSNPFGKDDVDFPLDQWAFDVYRKVHAVLAMESVGSTFSVQMQRPSRVSQTVDVHLDPSSSWK
eukprot:TRINITY_DN4922_c0_g1_i5.p2 TRINITY_DN4922_c0_g1~~TRINITY_DN4922_c0_g1_i5.p2  ORF type:complete len:282 (-),score=70.78 TRINITY_DN4922_c0_g1_i5:79-924(-)